MNYQVGDIIVHPLHGAGVIDHIESRRIDGKDKNYFVMALPGNAMSVMIPVDSCDKVGVRPLATERELEEVLSDIPKLVFDPSENWNKRYRENMLRIKNGNLSDLASVIKSLLLREQSRGLSTGERKMLVQSKQILLSEISYIKNISFAEAELDLLNRVSQKEG